MNSAKRLLILVSSGVAAISGLVVGLLIAFGVILGGSNLEMSPQGTEVDRLAPISVRFEEAPVERDGSQLLHLEPAIRGDYVWQDERTLLFQPEFPGLMRGVEYTVSVPQRPEAGVEDGTSWRFTTADRLEVTTVVPAPDDVEVPNGARVLVQLNRATAPLTLLSEQNEADLLIFDPPLSGHGEWLNTSLYRFTPDDGAVSPNTKYEVRLPAGLGDTPDGMLQDDYVWSFTTYGPAINGVTPDTNTQFAGPRQQVSVRFNQPMDRSSVEHGFQLLRDGNAVNGGFDWSENDTTATFTPADPLSPLANFEVVLPDGLKGARGGATAREWRSKFTTVGPPTVTSTTPPDGSTSGERYGVQIKFSNPMDEASLEGKLTISGVETEAITSNLSPDQRMLYVGARFDSSTHYDVHLADGATDRYGQPLGAFSFSFTTGARPPSLSLAIPGEYVTYSASAEPVLYFQATNTDEARFTLYPLTSDEASRLRDLNSIPRGSQPFVPQSAALYSWTEDVSGPHDQVLLKSTSLSRNGQPLPKGDYFVDTNSQNRPAFAFTVVDTAIVAKQAHDQLLVWALDLESGEPLANLALHVAASPLAGPDTLRTDAQGLATFALPPLTGQIDAKQRRYVVSVTGSDRTGVSVSGWQSANLWELQIPQEYYPKTYVGHVYTDRPIYRPGEEVLYKGVIRLDNDAEYSVPTTLENVSLLIQTSRGREIKRESVSVNDFGSFAGSLDLPADTATGDYQISLLWGPDRGAQSFGASSFLVAEFRKPEFQVDVATDRESFVVGETIDTNVEASFFFGGPLEDAKVQWSVMSGPFSPKFEGYEDYSFVDFDQSRTLVYRAPQRASGDGATDSLGSSRFSVPAAINTNEGPQQYQLSATVTDLSAQSVAGVTTVTVHPAALYAGIQAPRVLRSGVAATAEVVTVDTDGNIASGRDVMVAVYDRTWITTKEQTPEGARRYRSEPRDTLLTTLSATTGPDGKASVSFTPAKAGTLRLVATTKDDAGRSAQSATYGWVTGTERASWQITNTDALELIADKKEYRVGDTAQILVPAPFENAIGLITVERGKVRDSSVQTFPTNNQTISIPIVDTSVPDIFVGVVLYRPPTADDAVPRFKIGYVQLKVSTDTRVLNVSIRPDREQAQPGETVRYDLQVTDAQGRGRRSEVSVSVVDKAILSLTEERGPDGLHAFWFERGLGVVTSSSLSVSVNRSNDVISEANAGGKGGGGADERLRQDFRNSAYWEAQLVTDASGRASIEVVMPDNLTTWRLQARAISGDILVGEGTSELLSTQPLLLRPALPRFLRVGDEPVVRALVRNATREATSVTVSLEAEGIGLPDGGERHIDLAAGQSVAVEWPATVSDEGTAKLSFAARSESGLSDAVVQQLPVYLDVTPEEVATGGVVRDRPLEETIYLPPYALLDKGGLTVKVQASLMGSVIEQLDQFAPTIYERPEQIASRLAASSAVLRADPDAATSAPYGSARLSTDATALINSQRSDGSWSWCPGCPPNPQVTAWALVALGEWRAQGNTISSGVVLSNASTYLHTYLNRMTDVEHPADPNEKAYLLYALAHAGTGSADLPTMRAVFQQSRADLKNWGRAYLLLAFAEAGLDRSDPDVGQLINDLTKDTVSSANGSHWDDAYTPGSTHSSSRTTALAVQALARIRPDHPLVEEATRWLVVALKTNLCRTPVERAEAIIALSGYAATTEELGATFAYDVELDGAGLLSGELSAATAEQTESTTKLADLGAGTSILKLARDFGERGRMYYTLGLRYTTPAREIESLNRGFAVSHEYSLLAAPGESVDEVKLGDIVRVTVTVVSDADRHFVAVEDALPAGLEAIDPRLQTTDPALKARLSEERRQARPDGLSYNAPWLGWYFSPWQQVDLRDERVALSAEHLPRGVYEYVYYARATTPGDFFVAPAHAEESYFPEVFGRSDSARFTVTP